MPTETLHYESARFAQQLFNNDTGNLRLVEEELGVRATSREGWIKLEGQPEDLERAKQLFQILAGFHSGPRQNDPADFFLPQRGHGHRHRQVRFPRAGRSNPERHVVLADGLHIALLLGRLRRDVRFL